MTTSADYVTKYRTRRLCKKKRPDSVEVPPEIEPLTKKLKKNNGDVRHG